MEVEPTSMMYLVELSTIFKYFEEKFFFVAFFAVKLGDKLKYTLQSRTHDYNERRL